MTLVPPKDIMRSLATYTDQYHESYPGSPAEKYLTRRGITKEAANYFRLGFVADPDPEQRAYRGCLAIPYLTPYEAVLGIKYRFLDDRKPKYSSSIGFESRRIYNPSALIGQRTVYVTEGEIDTITLHTLGVPAIAIPGATNWNPVAARALRNRRVIVLADGDDSLGEGYKLAKQITRAVEDSAIVLMEGTDVNQFYLDHGREKLLEYIGWNEWVN